jgi:hypothetical protein
MATTTLYTLGYGLTGHNVQPFKAKRLLFALPSLTLHHVPGYISIFLMTVRKTEFTFLKTINQSVFAMDILCVFYGRYWDFQYYIGTLQPS